MVSFIGWLFRARMTKGGIFSLKYFSILKLWLHTKNPRPRLPGSALKVCVKSIFKLGPS